MRRQRGVTRHIWQAGMRTGWTVPVLCCFTFPGREIEQTTWAVGGGGGSSYTIPMNNVCSVWWHWWCQVNWKWSLQTLCSKCNVKTTHLPLLWDLYGHWLCRAIACMQTHPSGLQVGSLHWFRQCSATPDLTFAWLMWMCLFMVTASNTLDSN